MTGKPLTDDWRSWLRLNVARGCLKESLYDKCVKEQGFSSEEVRTVLEETTGKKQDNTKETKEEDETTSLQGSFSKPLNNGWKEWLRLQLDQGAPKEELFLRCVQEQLNLDEVSQALGGYRARTYEPPRLPKPEFTKRTFTPRAWKLDTDLLEIYEIPNFLTSEECHRVIQAIDSGVLQQSVVTRGPADSRTSRTCHLRIEAPDGIAMQVEQKLRMLMGPHHDPTCAETLQGQRYGVGDYFHAHTDWFTPNTDEYETHCQVGGQRTWTIMVYLNNVDEGGGTKFENILREFVPSRGTALAWNNLDADSRTPNPWTLHEAMPVTNGTKYVLTKWYRERPMV